MPFQYDKNFIELRKNPNDHFYYKVGDKVRIVDTDEIGTVCELINEKYYVVRTFHFLKVEDLELVPHPDTARLDFVIKNRFVATFSDDFDDDYLIVRGQIPDPAKTFGRGFSPRQAIDNAMQQEQTP